jgi:hypothetical protein
MAEASKAADAAAAAESSAEAKFDREKAVYVDPATTNGKISTIDEVRWNQRGVGLNLIAMTSRSYQLACD